MRSHYSGTFLAMAAAALTVGCAGRLSTPAQAPSAAGGVSLTYRLVLEPGDLGRLDPMRENVRRILKRRASGLSAALTANVRRQGAYEYVVEIFGTIDPGEAAKVVGASGSLDWYWAKNVTTKLMPYRRYSEEERGKTASPAVAFYDHDKDKAVPPYTAGHKLNPEYQKMVSGWVLILGADDMAQATVMQQPNGGVIPSLDFTSAGAIKMEKWCRKYIDDEENLACVVDGVVISFAPLRKGSIIKDRAIIEGTFDPKYVQELVQRLNSGVLPVKLRLISAVKVKPS